MVRVVLAALVVIGWAGSVEAGGCCPGCGCGKMKKVCVPVCEMKKETTYEYSCKCEDFCIPGPGKVVGHCIKKDCRGCEHCCPVRQPTCARVQTRVLLQKMPVVKEKPHIHWVVKTVCCGCGRACGSCAADGGPCADEVAPEGRMPTEAPGVPPMPPVPAARAIVHPTVTEATPSATSSSGLIQLLSAEEN